MLESVHVFRNLHGNKFKEKAKHTLHICAYYPISTVYPQDCQFAILAMQCFPYKDIMALQVQASASKLQQLPWTAVFADLQFLLLSADAPGLSPYRNACVCTCLDMFQNHPEKTDVKAKAKHILHIFAYHSRSIQLYIPQDYVYLHIYILAYYYPKTFAMQCFPHKKK